MGVIEKKNTTLGRLQRLILGAKTEKTRNVFPGQGATNPAVPPKRPARGHPRSAQDLDDYRGRVVRSCIQAISGLSGDGML